MTEWGEGVLQDIRVDADGRATVDDARCASLLHTRGRDSDIQRVADGRSAEGRVDHDELNAVVNAFKEVKVAARGEVARDVPSYARGIRARLSLGRGKDLAEETKKVE